MVVYMVCGIHGHDMYMVCGKHGHDMYMVSGMRYTYRTYCRIVVSVHCVNPWNNCN